MSEPIYNGGTLPEVTVSAMKTFSFDFDAGKKVLFTKGYIPIQVDSVNAIMGQMFAQSVSNKAQCAYILATAYHEAFHVKKGLRIVPIKEMGGDAYLSKYDTGKLAKDLGNTPQADGDGQLYAGRGFVMITGKRNYEKFSKIMGIDLLKNPDLTLDVNNSAFILVYGMIHGTFTGKKLSDYINSGKIDYQSARKIINGSDQAPKIAGYASEFMKCIK